mgnify:CR=1 FL=1
MLRVLLATHLSPVIHGQALMASQLASANAAWSDIELYQLNTSYAETREALKGGGLKKIFKLRDYLREAEEIIRNEKIDILIVTPAFFRAPFFKDQYFLRTLKKRTGVKVVGWVHMDPERLEFDRLPYPLRRLAASLVKNVDHWVSCASSLASQWPFWIVGDATKVNAISNGIPDPSPIDAKLSHSPKRLMYLSSMDPEKGWRDLYDVAVELCETRVDFEVHFYGGVGAGESQEALQEKFSTGPHASRIQWHGATWDDDKQRAFQCADLFVFPSHTEQFPISILEAMAHRLPIIATNVGAVRDALPDQPLLEAKNRVQLSSAITDFLDRPEHYNDQGNSNRQRFVERFSRDAFLKAWQQLLIQFN